MKEDNPKDNILKIFLSNLKDFLFNVIDLNFFKYNSAIINDIICPMIVANAPPFTPNLNIKMNIGSKIMFIIAPIINIIIEYFGEPSARIMLESEEYIKEKEIANIEEILELTNTYDKINKIGIPTYNFLLINSSLIKVIIYTLIVIVINFFS